MMYVAERASKIEFVYKEVTGDLGNISLVGGHI